MRDACVVRAACAGFAAACVGGASTALERMARGGLARRSARGARRYSASVLRRASACSSRLTRIRRVETARACAAKGLAAHEEAQVRAMETLRVLAELRLTLAAPVDVYGPSALTYQCASESERQYQVLISTMLSSQTRDLALGPVVRRLQETSNASGARGLTVERILGESEESLSELLRGVSFHHTKAKNILAATQRLVSDFDAQVPRSLDSLLALKGVGQKMAHIVMHAAFGDITGIAVDTHVHRIANRLGWASSWHSRSNAPEKTRNQLEVLFPREQWQRVNHTLVAFGQTICEARRPQCSNCPVAQACVAPQIGQQPARAEVK